MNIAIIRPGLHLSGGSQRLTLELALELQKKGHKVDVFCFIVDKKACYPDLIKKVNIHSVVEIKPSQGTDLVHSNVHNISSRFKSFVFRVGSFSIVKHSSKFFLYNLVRKYNKKNKYAFFNYHDDAFFLSLFFPKEKNFWTMNDLPLLFHSQDAQKSNSLLKNNIYQMLKALFKFFYIRKITNIIVLDRRNKALVRKYFDADAVIVRGGIDTAKFYFKRRFLKKKIYTILCVNIFFPYRRYEDLIRAIGVLVNKNKMQNLHLNIIGKKETDINYYNFIVSLVKKNNIEKYVSFLGTVSEQQLSQSYKTADIFVFPNNNQTWGLSVFEAILGGCAVIVSKGAGAHEVLEDGKTALLVPPESPHKIAEKIDYLLKDYKKLKQIVTAGQEFVLDNFSWRKYANNIEKLFLDAKTRKV